MSRTRMQSGHLVDHLIIIFWTNAISVCGASTHSTNFFLFKQGDCNMLNFNMSSKKSVDLL